MGTALEATKAIGPWGSAARALTGAVMVVSAAVIGIDPVDALVGLALLPLAVVAAISLRGRDAPPLRLIGPEGYCLNCAMGVAAFVFLPVGALLFYGSSMLLAATRGYAGCELFAVSNWLRHRNDQIACPVFAPIDTAERRARAGSATSEREA
jgi:hypothetical protein